MKGLMSIINFVWPPSLIVCRFIGVIHFPLTAVPKLNVRYLQNLFEFFLQNHLSRSTLSRSFVCSQLLDSEYRTKWKKLEKTKKIQMKTTELLEARPSCFTSVQHLKWQYPNHTLQIEQEWINNYAVVYRSDLSLKVKKL